MTEVLAAAGIVVTEEGKARARAKLAAADAFWTDERRAELREQLGLSDAPATGPHATEVQPTDTVDATTMTDLLAARGMVSTPEGRARARAKLAAADAFWTRQRRNELRRQLGLEERLE
jgi:hypothetical protein